MTRTGDGVRTGDDPRFVVRAETLCRNSEEASVLALARELAAAAERGDVAEVVRLAEVIAACSGTLPQRSA